MSDTTIRPKFSVDVNKRVLIITLPSTGETIYDNVNYHHKFTEVFIDSSSTFNCGSGPSSFATNSSIRIDWDNIESSTNNGYDEDLIDYEIPFTSIMMDENSMANELFFIWVKECSYTKDGDEYFESANEVSSVTGQHYPINLFALTLSVSTFYNILLNHIKINTEDCNKVGCSDVNFMLAWDGFNLAKTLQDYKKMIYYWKILHTQTTIGSNNSCNCH